MKDIKSQRLLKSISVSQNHDFKWSFSLKKFLNFTFALLREARNDQLKSKLDIFDQNLQFLPSK